MFDRIKLNPKYKPHDYQLIFLDHAIDSINSNPETWHLYSSPTGTGKSIMELLLLSTFPGGILITPRLEIINGMLEKCGHPTDLTEKQTIELASTLGIFTPIRLRNMLSQGLLNSEPKYLIVDECHHDMAQSYQDITMYLNGVPKVGLTATPFRGTPKSTRSFLAQWSDTVNTILTVPQAVDMGYCSIPHPVIWPLVDCDQFKIVNGEYNQKQVDETVDAVLDTIVKKVGAFYNEKSLTWDRPTMFSVPSVASAKSLKMRLDLSGLPCHVITGDTPYNHRQNIFRSCVNRMSALVQVNVVSEGVDLPIRRLIDCAPTMSPVKWMQQIGRIMRPSDTQPEYYCICRNLERHGYLMDGAFPSTRIVEVQNAFDRIKGGSSRSATMRVLGTEGLSRFIATPVKLLNGLTVYTYHLNYQTKFQRSEFYALVHPNTSEIIYGKKESTINSLTNEITWGKWKRVKDIPPIDGFTSIKRKDEVSDKVKFKWEQLAKAKGLDPSQTINNRVCQAMFFLLDIGAKL